MKKLSSGVLSRDIFSPSKNDDTVDWSDCRRINFGFDDFDGDFDNDRDRDRDT